MRKRIITIAILVLSLMSTAAPAMATVVNMR